MVKFYRHNTLVNASRIFQIEKCESVEKYEKIRKKIKEREWVGVKREDKFLSSFFAISTTLSNFRLILKLTRDISIEINKRSLKKTNSHLKTEGQPKKKGKRKLIETINTSKTEVENKADI